MRVQFLTMSTKFLTDHIFTREQCKRQFEFEEKRKEHWVEMYNSLPMMKDKPKTDWRPSFRNDFVNELNALIGHFELPPERRLYNDLMFWMSNNSLFEDEDGVGDIEQEETEWMKELGEKILAGYREVLDLIIVGKNEEAFIKNREYEMNIGTEMWGIDTSVDKYLDVVYIKEL